MGVAIAVQINEKLYLRDPQSSALGRNIIQHSITLIDEIGFEAFTFKKLAESIPSTEASVYRYFENKHMLLVYLLNWYWEWVGYNMDINTNNVYDAEERLQKAIQTIMDSGIENPLVDFVNEEVLCRIVIKEANKAHHTIEVDAENEEGFFLSYKALVSKLSNIMLGVNPAYPYPRTLATTIIETAHNQQFYYKHLPRLTDVESPKNGDVKIEKILSHMATTLLRHG